MKTNIKISVKCAYVSLVLLLLISCTTRSDPGTPNGILANGSTNNGENENNGNGGNENTTPEDPGKTFEVIDPATGDGLGETCYSASDCLQGSQNHNPSTGNVESGSEPICFDTTEEIPERELRSVNITINLCVYGNEALIITNNVMQVIHYSTGKGEMTEDVHDEKSEDPKLFFFEFPNINLGKDCEHFDSTVTQSNEQNAQTWYAPAFIPYNLGLNIDTLCTTSISSSSYTFESDNDEDFEVLLDYASNRNNYQTWVFRIENKQTGVHKASDGRITFTYEYMERL
jgi:hypothetical protein